MAGQSGLPSKLKYLLTTKIDSNFRHQISFIIHVTSGTLTERWGSTGKGSAEADSDPKTRKIRDVIELINLK